MRGWIGNSRGQGDPAVGTARGRVRGYWPDNWVEPTIEVVVEARDQTRELRLVGRSIVAMDVEISANGTRLGRFELKKGKREVITVSVPPGPRETLSFAFSHSLVDSRGRSVSFLLEGTNLFKEDDLAARRVGRGRASPQDALAFIERSTFPWHQGFELAPGRR